MNKNNLKQKTKNIFSKIKNKVWIIPTTLFMMQTGVYAEGSISTAEVNQATENIKSAIIKLAMPIRRNFSICKYCNYSIKNDSKFK